MRNKNHTVDALKGIAIVLVVYGHVIQRTLMPNGIDFFSNPAFKVIYTFHMPLFMFISGYLMAYSLGRKNALDVFISRYRGLCVPYFSWIFLGILVSYILNMVKGISMGKVIFMRHLHVLDQLFYNPSIWFLFTLFTMSCMLLCSVLLERKIGWLAFPAVYALTLIVPYNQLCDLYYIQWFYVFFLGGYFINRYDVKITRPQLTSAVFLVTLAIFVVLVSFWNNNDYIYLNKMTISPDHYARDLLRIIYRWIIGFIGILIAFCIGEYVSKTKMQSFLACIGLYTLDIYLIQRYLVEQYYAEFVKWSHISFDSNSIVFLAVFVPVLTGFFIVICICISKLLIKSNDVANKMLLGGRA